MGQKPELDDFPQQTFEKLRYVDTDRQGHINNAVFASMLETGRVEILYDPDQPLYDHGCSFVIVSLAIDFHAEITWPGQVEIGTRVVNLGRSSITIEQGLFQYGECAATANTVIVHVNNAEKRSEPLSEDAVRRLSALMQRD